MAKNENEIKVRGASDAIGIDPGFSDIKYATSTKDFSKFVTAVAEIKGYHTNVGGDIYELNGRYYYVGEKATKQPANTIVDLSNYDDLERFLPLLIAHTFKLAGKKFSKVCLGLSPAQIQHVDSFRKAASRFVVNGEEYNLDVKVAAQGVGAALSVFELNDLCDKDVLIVDGGFNTIDIIFCYDGQIQVELVNSDNAFENKGIIGVVDKLIETVSNKYGISIGVRDAQQCLNTKSLKFRGNVIDLTDDIAECVKRYTKEIVNFLKKEYGSNMDKMDSVYIVGGLAYLIDPNIDGYAPGYIKTFKNSEYLNAIGNYLKISKE